MKQLIKAALAFLLVWVVMYLLGAFVSWSFNAGTWAMEMRLILAVLGTGVGVIAAVPAGSIK